MSEINLPEEWCFAPLSSAISPDGLISDGDWVESKDQDENGNVRLIQLADIGDGDFRNKSQKTGEFVINNMPLGAMKGSKYSLKKINYEKGDTLLLMSDGFAELKNQNDEQYGYARVKKEFMSVAQKNANEIVEHLKNSASEWSNGNEPDDDVTFVVIKIK